MAKRLRTLLAAIVAGATTAVTIGGAQVATAATPASTAAKPQHVIVLLKDQPAAAKPGTAAGEARARRIAAAQAPVIRDVRSGLQHLKPYRTLDAFAATLPASAVADLKADAAVAAVIPDTTIRIARSATPKHGSGGATTLHDVPGACTAKPQREEASVAVKAVSDDPKATTARSLGYTGKGVKVAWLADGIDTKNVNFLRDPGDPASTVFTDYRDFSGDGPDASTTAAEAFIDANAIAGQGKHVYDVRGFSATPVSGPCNIRIEGTAPGVDLVGLKVFADSGLATTSGILQAIDYAVQTDHVDVINESFGANPFPDVTTADVVERFNDTAVDAGVTVTVSSGDSGPFNTNGSPSTDPKVVAVGGSTTYRFYAQTNYANARYFAPNGWENGNISQLSSSGVTEDGNVLDLVAPGDLSWASCTADPIYEECVDFRGRPSEVLDSGGTSESAPVTAGVAALVIEAYERAHSGVRPTPNLVKRILTSTATDLTAPAEEQGAGLVDAAKAVQLAASIDATPLGDTILTSVTQLAAADRPGSPRTFRVGLTNEGARPQRIRLSGRTNGPDQDVRTGSVRLHDGANRTVVDYFGRTNNVAAIPFDVSRRQDRLTFEYSYTGDPNGSVPVRVDLVDPQGKLASYSIPQGSGNHGTAEALRPEAGSWTAYVFSPTGEFAGTQGRVPYRIATQRSQAFASIVPRSLRLAPGMSTVVTVSARTPADPGDQTGALVVDSDLAGTGSVPIVLRSRIDASSGGRFSGIATGGNGRDFPAQRETYTFRVPEGATDVLADLKLQTEADEQLGLYLVGPGGDIGGFGQNTVGESPTKTATATVLKPVPGIWTLIVVVQTPTDGEFLRVPFSGAVRFDAGRADAPGLPNDQRVVLPAGKPVTVPVRVRNTGGAAASVFIDPRTRLSAPLALAGQTPTTDLPVPSDGERVPFWFVPSETTSLSVTGTGTVPVQFDVAPALVFGDPDVESRSPDGGFGCASTETAAYAARDRALSSEVWFAQPSECGPYDSAPPSGTVDFSASATTRGFDRTVTSPTGDAEFFAIDPDAEVSPVVIAPGATATIPVTITPKGAPGTRMTGDLFVDAFLDDVPPYAQQSANELVSLPYDYTIR